MSDAPGRPQPGDGTADGTGDVPRDRRPRPRYGEYATPQEQAEIVARSMPPVSPHLVPHDESVPVPSGLVEPAASAAPRPAAPATPATDAITRDAAGTAPGRRRWDLILSVGLLAYGLLTVLAAFLQYSDIPALMNQVYETQSIGRFTATDAAANAGRLIIVSNVVLYALTVWLTVRRLMARGIAFWIPLAGGILAGLVTIVTIGVVIANDPAFQAYVTGMTGTR